MSHFGFKSRVLTTASALALCALPALAQGNADVETVVVTGSQIQMKGFTAPTPVTTVDQKDLQLKAVTNLSSLQNDIPEFKPNQDVSANNLPIGGANLDLRGLGPTRTLVMLDTHRIEATNPNGGVDVTIIPGALIKNVEIVTGGASAAYGSDAVSGVVNFILDTQFDGFKADAQYGQTKYNDVREGDVNATLGTDFLGGKGHIVMSADYYHNTGEQNESTRPWGDQQACQTNNPSFVTSGANGPKNLFGTHCSWSNMTNGGLITTGPLKGIAFNPGGSTYQFNYGNVVGTFWQLGGSGDQENDDAPIYPREQRASGFVHATYDITDNISMYAEGLYSRETGFYHLVSNYDSGTTLTIHNDNAYLSSALKTAMATAKITTFTLGRSGLDNGFGGNYSVQNVGRYQIGFNGKLWSDWTWDATGQISRNHYLAQVPNNRLQANFYNAADAVISPTTGQPVCRVTLTDPTNPCQPANVFGYGMISQASQAYFIGTSSQVEHENADDFDANLRGSPFDLWAGPISVATGFEWRQERINGRSDPYSLVNAWRTNNPKPLKGGDSVTEGYVEIAGPLLAPGPWVEKATFDIAGRVTGYSTSGEVETWKAGLDYQPIDDFRLRGTLSHDIRAPSIYELFLTQTTVIGNAITDPFRNNAGTLVQALNGGNPNLKPEISDTRTFGVVFTPSFIEGLNLSVDYYNINIGGAIGSNGSVQQIINNCYAGQTVFCPFIIRDPTSGQITQVQTVFINSQRLKENGVDVELRYNVPMSNFNGDWGGNIDFRVLGNYVGDDITVNNNISTNNAGQTASGVPHLRVNFGATYTNDPITFGFLVRTIDRGIYNATYTQGYDINNNHIAGRAYIDLNFNYRYSDNWQFYARGVNILDVDPPLNPPSISLTRAATSPYFDLLGARWIVGVRFVD